MTDSAAEVADETEVDAVAADEQDSPQLVAGQTYEYREDPYYGTVPAGITKVRFQLAGGQGGYGTRDTGGPGRAAPLEATVRVVEGQVLRIVVADHASGRHRGEGWVQGGAGGSDGAPTATKGAGGGGASAVLDESGGTVFLVGGGGGGGGGEGTSARGGNGGRGGLQPENGKSGQGRQPGKGGQGGVATSDKDRGGKDSDDRGGGGGGGGGGQNGGKGGGAGARASGGGGGGGGASWAYDGALNVVEQKPKDKQNMPGFVTVVSLDP